MLLLQRRIQAPAVMVTRFNREGSYSHPSDNRENGDRPYGPRFNSENGDRPANSRTA